MTQILSRVETEEAGDRGNDASWQDVKAEGAGSGSAIWSVVLQLAQHPKKCTIIIITIKKKRT